MIELSKEVLLDKLVAQVELDLSKKYKGNALVYRKVLKESDDIRGCLSVALDVLAETMLANKPFVSICRKIGFSVYRMVDIVLAKDNLDNYTDLDEYLLAAVELEAEMVRIGMGICGYLEKIGEVKLRLETEFSGEKIRSGEKIGGKIFTTNHLFSANASGLLVDLLKTKGFAKPELEPQLWTSPVSPKGRTLITKVPTYLLENYTEERIPLVYKALNAYGSTKFQVNQRALDVIIKMDEINHIYTPKKPDAYLLKDAMDFVRARKKESLDDEVLFNLYNELAPLSHKEMEKWMKELPMPTSGKGKAEWFNNITAEQRLVLRAHSQYFSYNKAIDHAMEMAQHKAIYFRLWLDSRGRIYSSTNYLSPLGDDLSKALLQFTDGDVCLPGSDEEKALMTHIACCAGEDKLSWDERIQWVLDNESDILDAGRDPVNSEWLKGFRKDAKTKYQLVVACVEWFVKSQDPMNYVCHLSIGLDATNSGLGIYSMLTRDVQSAQDTNILQHPDKPIGDAYAYVVDQALLMDKSEEIMRAARSRMTEAQLRKELRKVFKRSVMVTYYSAGEACKKDNVYVDRDTYNDDIFVNMSREECNSMGNLIHEATKGAYHRPQAAMDELKGAVDKRLESDTTALITWTNPVGLMCFALKSDVRSKPFRSQMAGRRIDFNLQLYTGQAKWKSTKVDHGSAIAPNVIHSCDSSVLTMLVCKMDDAGITNIATVHDAFHTSVSNVVKMRELYRETLVELFTPDHLSRIYKEICGKELTDFDFGDMDIKDILKSCYAIC